MGMARSFVESARGGKTMFRSALFRRASMVTCG
jgi:hypothetical protein